MNKPEKLQVLSDKQLAARVRAREKFLKWVIRSVPEMVRKYGRVISQVEFSSYYKTEMALENFGGLAFRKVGSLSMFGGTSLKIYTGSPAGLCKVLDLDWWDDKDPKVNEFLEDKNWQNKLRRVVKNADRIAKRVEAGKEKEKRRQEKAAAVVARGKDLKDKARRLGVGGVEPPAF